MLTGLWGKKIGMTQVFTEDKVVPVTVVDIKPWIVTQIKTVERDGYNAVQVGYVKARYASETFASAWLNKRDKYFTFVREVALSEPMQGLALGQTLDFSEVVAKGESVDVSGITKACGFQGVVKRHGFRGGSGSHGSKLGRKPGSVGAFRAEGRVIKGKRLPGRMGGDKMVMQNLEVVNVEKEQSVVLIKGSVPGKSGSLVFIRKA